jgi:hypothetical protein
VPLLPRRAPPLAGYQELEEVQEGRPDGWWRAGWVQPDTTGTLLWVAGEPGTVVIAGLGTIGGPDQNNDPTPVSTLIVRREAASTTFVAALLTGYAGAGDVTMLPALRAGMPVAADEAIGIGIRAPRGDFDVLLAPGPGTYQIGGREVAGGQVVVARPDGTAEQAALG